MGAPNPWTEVDIEALRSMIAAGKPLSWICAKVKRTETSVRAKARELGLRTTRHGVLPRIHTEGR